MAQNVFEELSKKRTLVDRIATNATITTTIMAYLNLLAAMLVKIKGTPVEGIVIDDPYIDDADCFHAQVHFYPIAAVGPKVWGTTSNFLDYTKAKAAHLAGMLIRNPGLEQFFEKMVTMLENWAAHNRCRFEDIDIGGPDYIGQGPIIQKDTDMMLFKVGRRLIGKRL